MTIKSLHSERTRGARQLARARARERVVHWYSISIRDHPTQGCHKSQCELVGDFPVELPLGKGGYVMYLVHLFADDINIS